MMSMSYFDHLAPIDIAIDLIATDKMSSIITNDVGADRGGTVVEIAPLVSVMY